MDFFETLLTFTGYSCVFRCIIGGIVSLQKKIFVPAKKIEKNVNFIVVLCLPFLNSSKNSSQEASACGYAQKDTFPKILQKAVDKAAIRCRIRHLDRASPERSLKS